MQVARFGRPFGYSILALLVLVTPSANAAAQSAHEHASSSRGSDALLAVVRQATERFQDPAAAEAEGYNLLFGCVSGPDYGAMGLHFVNLGLVGDGKVDATQPEIVIYEPLPNGRMRLVGADYLVFARDWDPTHTQAPELNGQLFHLFESPNRFGLPAFYTLHVWAWKDNPAGAFSNWHSKVSCDSFAPQN
jgi:hypothetical protein